VLEVTNLVLAASSKQQAILNRYVLFSIASELIQEFYLELFSINFSCQAVLFCSCSWLSKKTYFCNDDRISNPSSMRLPFVGCLG